jgi:hypothetical protein
MCEFLVRAKDCELFSWSNTGKIAKIAKIANFFC